MNSLKNYNINHLQEIMINMKKLEMMEKKIKDLEKEKEKLIYEKEEIKKQFTCFSQDLVNQDFLEIDNEPYYCECCKRVVSGFCIDGSYQDKDLYIKYVCNMCNN